MNITYLGLKVQYAATARQIVYVVDKLKLTLDP